MDGSQAEIQAAHARIQPQMQQASPPYAAALLRCSADSQHTAVLLAGMNFILVLGLLFLIFVQRSS